MRQMLISKKALLNNILFIRNQAKSSKLMAYIKANAYGHGLSIIASFIEPYVDGVTVSDVESVELLKKINFKKKIVLTSVLLTKNICKKAIEYNIDLVVYDLKQLSILKDLKSKLSLNVWLKINTGMNRLGINIKDVDLAIKQLSDVSYIQDIILMTHCANADHKDHIVTVKQIELFNKIVSKYNLESCFANTSGIINMKNMHLDWVRLGIGLYGAFPYSQDVFEPVLQIKSQVLTIQNLSKGDYVGYDSCWQAKSNTKIAVIALGYADGVPAGLYKINWFVEINGKLYQVVGKVSMDLFTVEIGLESDVKVKDFVNFFSEKYNLYYLSNLIGRTNYELLSQLGSRLERILVD